MHYLVAKPQYSTVAELRGRTIALTGRADARGEDEYNMGLGGARADSVRRYLKGLGVDVAKSVCVVVVTHWHDDHINGLASILALAPRRRNVKSRATVRGRVQDGALVGKNGIRWTFR